MIYSFNLEIVVSCGSVEINHRNSRRLQRWRQPSGEDAVDYSIANTSHDVITWNEYVTVVSPKSY